MGISLIPVSLLFDATTASSPNLEGPWIWVKVFVFLFLLGVGAFFLNHFSRKKNLITPMLGKSKLSVIDTCSLGNRQFLVVAQYESDKHLLSVNSTGVTHLADLSKNTTVSSAESTCGESNAN
jgi:flagellar biogenesis protein FliO